MLPGAPGQSSVATREIIEVVKIAAGQAQRPAIAFECHELALRKLASTLAALGVAADKEYQQVA